MKLFCIHFQVASETSQRVIIWNKAPLQCHISISKEVLDSQVAQTAAGMK